MVTPLLDLKASTHAAQQIRSYIAQQAVAALKASARVDHDFLDRALYQYPSAMLWSRITFDKEWFESHCAAIRQDTISSSLALEASMQSTFNYQASGRLFALWNWQLPEDYAAVNVDHGREKITAALELIKRIWPEAWENIHAYAHGVVWFSSQRFYNFSYFYSYGSIFLRPDVLDKSLVEISTLIIHEVAHHVLFGELMSDPLILDDPARKVYSPLRRTERPIHGTYQSLAALVRMIIWLHQVLDYEGPLDEDLRAEATNTCGKYQDDLRLLVGNMRDIHYSERGQRIFDDFVFVSKHL